MMQSVAIHNVSSEFLVKMRRNARFEPSGFAIVISFKHLRH